MPRQRTMPPASCVICGAEITERHKPSRPRRYCSNDCYKARARPLADRFWKKVSKDGPIIRPELGPCWVWTGAIDRGGYGKIGLGSRAEGWDKASRVSWRLHRGPITSERWVLHHCDNPPCVRPDHLYLGTVIENVRDAQDRGLLVGAGKGEVNHKAKLTEDQVREIRRRAADGERIQALADEYGFTYVGLWSVVRRKTWSHVV